MFIPILTTHSMRANIINRIFYTFLFLALGVMVGACSSDKGSGGSTDSTAASTTPEPKENREIVVFVAASLRESIQELGAMFEKQTGTRVMFNLAGSNELARQILAAPKADIFLSAAENWMDTVEQAKRVMGGTRSSILSNMLVVVAKEGSEWKLDDPCGLATLKYKNLALGDPEAVPAGKYAKQWLTATQCNGKPLWDAVKAKVAPAPDVRAALAQVIANPDMIGMVYKTDWMAFQDKARVLYEVKDGPPISYAVAQIAESPNPDGAGKFLAYLKGAEAKQVFEKHGFTFTAQGSPTP